MIRAVFFDIDGTLLSHTTGGVPGSAEEAVRRLRERGVRVFAATGRHMLALRALPVRRLAFDGYVTLNGQLCLDGEGAVLYDKPIPPADAQRMTAIFARGEIPVMMIERERMYVNFVDESVRRAQAAVSSPVPEIARYEGGRLYQFIVYDAGDRIDQVAGQLTGCKLSRWNPYAVDVIPRSGGKAAGIRRCLEHLDIAPEEIMAFGDGENDMTMLEEAGVSVAMGNGDEQVRALADYVTDTVDNDGVSQALRHFGLLPEEK